MEDSVCDSIVAALPGNVMLSDEIAGSEGNWVAPDIVCCDLRQIEIGPHSTAIPGYPQNDLHMRRQRPLPEILNAFARRGLGGLRSCGWRSRRSVRPAKACRDSSPGTCCSR